jgi:hypothetical protein
MIKDTPDFQFPLIVIGANDGVIDAFLDLNEWAASSELSVGPQSGGVAVDSAGSAWDIHCRQMEWPAFHRRQVDGALVSRRQAQLEDRAAGAGAQQGEVAAVADGQFVGDSQAQAGAVGAA